MSYPDPEDYTWTPVWLYVAIIFVIGFLFGLVLTAAHADTLTPEQSAYATATSNKLVAEINHGLTCDAKIITLQAELDSLKAKVPELKKK